MPRFSKNSFLKRLVEQAANLQERYGFDSHRGWAQVEHRDTEAKIAYGQFSMLQDLMEDLES